MQQDALMPLVIIAMAATSCGNTTDTIRVHPLSYNPDMCWAAIKSSKTIRDVKPIDLASSKSDGHVRFVCISDTHGQTDGLILPSGDVLLHAGDFTQAGDIEDVIKFNEFLGKYKERFQHIIVIAGNHETSFDGVRHGIVGRLAKAAFLKSPFRSDPTADYSKSLLTNCTYLEDSHVKVFGFKIYGSPWQPVHFHLGFNLNRGQDLLEKWNLIPEDTDILVTHGPPLGYGDVIHRGNHVGCAELLATVQERVQPKLHLFGHIHEAYGMWSDGVTTFVNASSCDRKYRLANAPIIFDLPLLDNS